MGGGGWGAPCWSPIFFFYPRAALNVSTGTRGRPLRNTQEADVGRRPPFTGKGLQRVAFGGKMFSSFVEERYANQFEAKNDIIFWSRKPGRCTARVRGQVAAVAFPYRAGMHGYISSTVLRRTTPPSPPPIKRQGTGVKGEEGSWPCSENQGKSLLFVSTVSTEPGLTGNQLKRRQRHTAAQCDPPRPPSAENRGCLERHGSRLYPESCSLFSDSGEMVSFLGGRKNCCCYTDATWSWNLERHPRLNTRPRPEGGWYRGWPHSTWKSHEPPERYIYPSAASCAASLLFWEYSIDWMDGFLWPLCNGKSPATGAVAAVCEPNRPAAAPSVVWLHAVTSSFAWRFASRTP